MDARVSVVVVSFARAATSSTHSEGPHAGCDAARRMCATTEAASSAAPVVCDAMATSRSLGFGRGDQHACYLVG